MKPPEDIQKPGFIWKQKETTVWTRRHKQKILAESKGNLLGIRLEGDGWQ